MVHFAYRWVQMDSVYAVTTLLLGCFFHMINATYTDQIHELTYQSRSFSHFNSHFTKNLNTSMMHRYCFVPTVGDNSTA